MRPMATLSTRTDGNAVVSWPIVTTPSRRRREVGDVVGVEGDLDEDQPVDAAVEGGRGVDGLATGDGVRCGEHEQVVADVGADRLGAGDDVGEVPRVDQRDDDGDGVAAARRQA